MGAPHTEDDKAFEPIAEASTSDSDDFSFEEEGDDDGTGTSGSSDDESGDFDSELDQEAGESESDHSGEDDDGVEDGEESGDSDSDAERNQAVEESDSSEDEVAPRNTIGDVPLEWYKDEPHVGYDIKGKKLTKKERQDKLDSLLARADDSTTWRRVYDEYNDEYVEVTKEEARMIRRVLKGGAPHGDFDPYPTYVDWFKLDHPIHPVSNAPEPKRRFIPSKWEAKTVVKLVRGIREGRITFDKPEEKPRIYNIWVDDSAPADKAAHLTYIPPPRPKLPGHEESYNPSSEFLLSKEEIDGTELMDEEDRPKFIPKRFSSMRSIPAYEHLVSENFERCLDMYLCPRVRKKRIHIDPQSLKPKLPSRKDLKPYPSTCYIEYRGHKGPVVSISTDPSGEWLASGSADGTVRIWDVDSGRCLKVWEFDDGIKFVSWNPELPILAVSTGQDVYILNTGLRNEETQKKVEELLHVEKADISDDSKKSITNWSQDDKYGGIRLRHSKTVSSVEWHRKGDYFSTVMPAGETKSVLIHMLSKKLTEKLPFKLKGLAVLSVFHPTRSIFFAATKKYIRVYDLVKGKLIKKLDPSLREISSIAIHPGGDNLIVGSREGKLAWFDMDLSSKPYKVLKCHNRSDVNNVTFHRSYPLFASASDDCTAYVFHGMVYSDLNQNPLIVPLEILRGHKTTGGRGVMDCKFHPRQPWLFTAGADSVIKLYCHY
ncbi:Ribosome biogenesis protein BOP1 homolog [Linum grandiflorum]